MRELKEIIEQMIDNVDSVVYETGIAKDSKDYILERNNELLAGKYRTVILPASEYEKSLGYNPQPRKRPSSKTEEEILEETGFMQSIERFSSDLGDQIGEDL